MKLNLIFLLGLCLAVTTSAATDDQLKWALGQIESGALSARQEKADFSIGRKREVSRYQILPDEWRRVSAKLGARSSKPERPDHAWRVASTLLQERTEDFIRATKRRPSDFEVYILWNAPGQFARVRYNPKDVSWVVRERAERFSNLVGVAPSKGKVISNQWSVISNGKLDLQPSKKGQS